MVYSFPIPMKLFLFQKIGQWLGQTPIMPNKFPVVSCGVKKTSELGYVRWCGPLSHHLSFPWICLDPFSRYDMPQILQLPLSKGTFCFLDVELMLSQ
jgi:hypothetical protein